MRRRGVHCNVIGDKLTYCLMYIEERRRPKIKPLCDEAIHWWPQFTGYDLKWRPRLSTLHVQTDFNNFAEAFRQTRVGGCTGTAREDCERATRSECWGCSTT